MNKTVRCAIYARFSSDLQRLTSIEDQLRRCREYAVQQGWIVEEEFVRCDEARSAATLAGGDSLQSLLAASRTSPPPFDCLMVDDTSRLARYLPDVLSMNDRLQYNGVFIYAVAQRLDCREKTSRPLLTLHGMMDEQFLVSLGEKVHRGTRLIQKMLEQRQFRIVWDHLGWFPLQVVPVLFPRANDSPVPVICPAD